MNRLIVHVEGETEESFVNEILAPYLYKFNYQKVSARLLGNARNRIRRGGIRDWNTVRRDILAHLTEDNGCIATTMVDYYALPHGDENGWSGRADASRLPYPRNVEYLQNQLLNDICNKMGTNFNSSRFIPYVMMHEFEGLLFSNCNNFAKGIGRPELSANFQSIRNSFNSPEEINDSPITAPSKRIQNLVEGYEKPLLGTLAILEIGLDNIRNECPNFHSWITRLEEL